MSEFFQTPEFERISNKVIQIDSLPVCIMLYYDDFAKYRLVPGKSGGLYFSVLNFEKKQNAKLDNIRVF